MALACGVTTFKSDNRSIQEFAIRHVESRQSNSVPGNQGGMWRYGNNAIKSCRFSEKNWSSRQYCKSPSFPKSERHDGQRQLRRRGTCKIKKLNPCAWCCVRRACFNVTRRCAFRSAFGRLGVTGGAMESTCARASGIWH